MSNIPPMQNAHGRPVRPPTEQELAQMAAIGPPPGQGPGPVPMQAVVATDVSIAGGQEGGHPIIVYQFVDRIDGNQFPPILLSSPEIPNLPDVTKTAVIHAMSLAGQPPVEEKVHCDGCGQRIFGEAAERGSCFACKPKVDQPDAEEPAP